jgi:hypothetical protein
MILKYRTTREENGAFCDIWNFVDGITDCSVFFDSSPACNCTCIEIYKNQNRDHMILALHDTAYLINDSGKTIEKIKG